MTTGEGQINTEDYRTIWASFNCAWKQSAQIVSSPQSLFQFGAIASVTASNQPGRLLFHPDGPEMASSKSWKENHLLSHIIPVWNHNASHKMLPSLKSFPSSSYFPSRFSLFVSPDAMDSPSNVLQSLPSRAIRCKLLSHTRSQTTKWSLPWPDKWLIRRDFLGGQKKHPRE